jgi:hypothetical protein
VENTVEARSPARDVWLRGLFMLLVIVGGGVAQAVLNLMALLQFGWLLFTGSPNRRIAQFGASLAKWPKLHAFSGSEAKPFPCAPRPAADNIRIRQLTVPVICGESRAAGGKRDER